MLTKYEKGEIMEDWKKSVYTGLALIILALLFSYARKQMSILMILVIILGIVDIIFGLYRKSKG